MAELYSRWQKQNLEKAMQTRRIILLHGARQCGKTPLAKQLASSDTEYRTLDNLALRELALNDPQGFVKYQGRMLIIDEVQRALDLLSAIKLMVDEDTRPGQFLLTGSANIQSLPGVKESLAGRIRKIRLRPLCQGELQNSDPIFLKNGFQKKFINKNKNYFDRKKLLEIAFRGGFPEAIKLENEERVLWHKDYIQALMERDLNDIAHITRHTAMQDLINVLSAWSGKFMDISAICAGLAIRRPTVELYMNALEILYLIEKVPPWTKTDYDRVGKQSKLFMTDSGLMTSILRWRFEQVELDSDRSGKLIETFIFNELASEVDASNEKYRLFHYRDREKREIDFLIESDDGSLMGIEVKASSVINSDDFKHLKWFRDNICKNNSFIGIVLYSGDLVGQMGENLWAVPFGAMWN